MSSSTRSQKDLFEDSENVKIRRSAKARVSSTLDPGQSKPVYKFDSGTFFDWDVDVPTPFAQFKFSKFNGIEIKPEWISKNLGTNSRITQLRNLSPFPGRVMSLFCKFEIGEYYLKFNKITYYLIL